MENQQKAQYLATIVAMLKNIGSKRQDHSFYGTTALISKSYESEIIERFRLVSAEYDSTKKNILFISSWFLIFCMFIFLSYSFVIRPDYEPSKNGFGMETEGSETTTGNTYSIECVDGTYYVHFRE